MSENTDTVDDSTQTDNQDDNNAGGLDKVRQQIQQELSNRDRTLESLSDTVSTLAEKIDALGTPSNGSAKHDEDDSFLDDLGDSDLVEGKQLAKAIKAIEKKIDGLGSAKLPDEQAKALEELKAQHEGQQAWAKFNKAFDSKFPSLVDRRIELVNAAIDEIEADPELDNSDLRGIVWTAAKTAIKGDGKKDKPRRSTEGTQVTRSNASSATAAKNDGDGIPRDSNGLPIALWPGED